MHIVRGPPIAVVQCTRTVLYRVYSTDNVPHTPTAHRNTGFAITRSCWAWVAMTMRCTLLVFVLQTNIAAIWSILPKLCAINDKTGFCTVSGPLPCPENPLVGGHWGCDILDLRIDVRPGERPQQGLFVRFLIPHAAKSSARIADNATVVPVMSQFPGTGTCFLETPANKLKCACGDVACVTASGCKEFQIAQDGVLVVQFAERGSAHCYRPDDIMTSTATWVGAKEFKDYDHVLQQLVDGKLHPALPRIDPERLGCSGGSHGGVETLLYSTRSTRFRFRLAVPEVGAASLANTWLSWAFDTRSPTPLPGFVPIAGFKPQVDA